MTRIQRIVKSSLFSVFFLFSIGASAEGFRCWNEYLGIKVIINDHVHSGKREVSAPNGTTRKLKVGTRTGAHLFITDMKKIFGEKTIFAARNEEGTLHSKKLAFLAEIKVSPSNPSLEGFQIAGIPLDQLDYVIVKPKFSYLNVLPRGAYLSGTLILVDRGDRILKFPLNCRRYLKRKPKACQDELRPSEAVMPFK